MKNAAILIALIWMIAACGGQKRPDGGSTTQVLYSSQKTPDSDPAQAAAKLKEASVSLPSDTAKCAIPKVVEAAQNAGDVFGLLDQLNEKYQLEEVHAYGQKNQMTSLGANVGSFYAHAEFGKSSSPGGSVDLHFDCKDVDASAKIEIPVVVPSIVYAPSQRVTVFDVNSGSFDNPEFNMTSLLKVYFDSNGTAYSINHSGEKPYTKNLYFKEIAASWPKDQKLTVRPDGKDGFQIVYTDSAEQFTRVVLIYGRAR